MLGFLFLKGQMGICRCSRFLFISLLHKGPYFNCLAPWLVDIFLNEGSVSGNIQMDHIPVTSSTGNLLNFIKSSCNYNNEQSVKELFNSPDELAFEHLVSSTNWYPNEPITVGNKKMLINIYFMK